MYDTLEARLTAAGYRTTKLQLAFDALNFADGNVLMSVRIYPTEATMYIPEPTPKYKVVHSGALPSAVRPRIEHGIEQLLNREQFTTNQKRFGRKVTTSKTRIG